MSEAEQAAQFAETGSYISKEVVERRRAAMLEDVWLFMKIVCDHGSDDIARFHRPLAYFLAGDAIRLAACLETYQSEVVSQIRAELTRREVDWTTPRGVKQLKKLLKRVNCRASRSIGKSLTEKDVILWKATVNPDIRILLVSKSDDAVWNMCEDIGEQMLSDPYKLYFGDRVDPQLTTKKWIKMVGRKSTSQNTIEARGATSQSWGKHYHEIYLDDLSSTEAKQGEATVEDAIRFISSLEGLSIAPRWGGTRYCFVGTIQSARDDHSKLMNNPEYISLVIPIWRHPKGKWSAKNIHDDGIPVLPELYDLDECRAKRAGTLANDSLGKISWLQNFLLCAHEAGSMQFTAELLLRQMLTWVHADIRDASGSVVGKRRMIRRYLYDEDGQAKQNAARASEPCRCYRKCGSLQHDYAQFSPLAVPRTLGVDQSLSPTGDDWGVGVVAVDSAGHKYQLKGAYGKDYWKMIPAISKIFNAWGGLANPPERIGIESNTWQSLSVDWMKRSEEMQFLARRIHKLPPTYTAKTTRIWNDVYSGLEDGTLWLDPDDELFQRCALDYNPAEPDKQKDDPLDAVAMAIQTHRYAATDMDDAAMKQLAQQQASQFSRDVDSSWTDMTTDFLEAVSWAN